VVSGELHTPADLPWREGTVVAIEWNAVTAITVTFVVKDEDLMRTYGNEEHKVLFRAREGYRPFG
jgi:hypothetical protein